ncbi:metal-dependent hydrolase [Patescibacteria group bacterium]|nr:metal-dependent hydrolase [Patescibacteria group bacterium]
MPSRKTHTNISLIVVVGVYIIFSVWKLPLSGQWQFLLSSIFIILGGIFPDLIEPVSLHSFAHRKFFHSVRLLLILVIATSLLAVIWAYLFRSEYILYAGSFFVGYVFHLIVDAFTKKSIPLK